MKNLYRLATRKIGLIIIAISLLLSSPIKALKRNKSCIEDLEFFQ